MATPAIARRWKIVLLLLLVVLATAVACWRLFPRPGVVSTALGEELRDKRPESIAMAALTRFPWATFFLFGPYSTRHVMCRQLRLDGPACEDIVPAHVGEGHYMFVFKLGEKVVHQEMHSRVNGDFMHSPSFNPIASSRSTFRVEYAPHPSAPDARATLFLQ